MPKKIILVDDKFRDQFIYGYNSKNEFNYVYTIKDLQRIFKLSQWTFRKISKIYGLSRNKQKKII